MDSLGWKISRVPLSSIKSKDSVLNEHIQNGLGIGSFLGPTYNHQTMEDYVNRAIDFSVYVCFVNVFSVCALWVRGGNLLVHESTFSSNFKIYSMNI